MNPVERTSSVVDKFNGGRRILRVIHRRDARAVRQADLIRRPPAVVLYFDFEHTRPDCRNWIVFPQ
jgi:hypothetical protein